MFLKKKFLFFSLFIFFFSFLPLLTTAQGIVPCGQGSNKANACTLCDLIVGVKNVIDFGMEILISVAAVGVFIAGVMYVISSGNEQMVTTAKNFLSASLIGFTVVLSAWLIVNVVMWILVANGNLGVGATNWYTFTCKV